MYLLDSCTCIDLMRGKLPETFKRIRECSPKMFGIPSIVEAELHTGAEKSARPDKTRYDVERFLSPFQIVPLGCDGARHYARIRAALEKAGRTIGPNDMIIAATALSAGATLITSNVKEFSRIPQLQIECWEEIDWSD